MQNTPEAPRDYHKTFQHNGCLWPIDAIALAFLDQQEETFPDQCTSSEHDVSKSLPQPYLVFLLFLAISSIPARASYILEYLTKLFSDLKIITLTPPAKIIHSTDFLDSLTQP